MSEFDKYIVQGEADKKAKANAWQTAIGLQDVDGLKTSEYLIKTAVQHIDGDITISQVKDMLDDYYQVRGNREDIEKERTDEADKVSARITEMLLEKTFSFTPDFLLSIIYYYMFKYAVGIKTTLLFSLRGQKIILQAIFRQN